MGGAFRPATRHSPGWYYVIQCYDDVLLDLPREVDRSYRLHSDLGDARATPKPYTATPLSR